VSGDDVDPVAELLSTAEQLAHATDDAGRGADDVASDEVDAFLAQVKATTRPDDKPKPVDQPKPTSKSPRPRTTPPPVQEARRPQGLLIGLGVAVVTILLIAAYAMGHSSGSTSAAVSAPASASNTPIDQQQVAALMAKIAADPKDTASLQALGNIYYDADDFANALTFYDKIAVLQPKDDGSWIAVAAAAFQSGKSARAFKAWNNALAINPDNIEAHYGLGHYYADQTPPDNDKAKAEWEKVIAIDAASPLAKEVASELAAINSAGATPGPSNS
jgi:cytochrome c-type biogenesis protein CcmH/NrfG